MPRIGYVGLTKKRDYLRDQSGDGRTILKRSFGKEVDVDWT
jgi:hypothetical protein